MGILNVTPDSFFDGGRFFNPDDALLHAKALFDEGADIVDIGGMSTRPGFEEISPEEELSRILPVLEKINVPEGREISIDTYRADVAEACLEVGCDIINDITAMDDPYMAGVISDFDAKVVLMYNRRLDENKTDDVVADCKEFLLRRIDMALAHGIETDKISIDPGIGFGTTRREDAELTLNLKAINPYEFPIVYGCSKKRFVQGLDTQNATGVVNAFAVLQGAQTVRVHDVSEVKAFIDKVTAEGGTEEFMRRTREAIECIK